MAFAIYLHRENFVPEAPLIVDKNVSDANVNFTFVDFVPGVIKRSNTVIPQCEVEYHSFRFVLLTRVLLGVHLMCPVVVQKAVKWKLSWLYSLQRPFFYLLRY